MSQIPDLCPKCGYKLVKEVLELKTIDKGSGSANESYVFGSGTACMGSMDTSSSSQNSSPQYVYRCPNCGYLYIDW